MQHALAHGGGETRGVWSRARRLLIHPNRLPRAMASNAALGRIEQAHQSETTPGIDRSLDSACTLDGIRGMQRWAHCALLSATSCKIPSSMTTLPLS